MSILSRLAVPLADARSISYQDVWGAGGEWTGGSATHAGVAVDYAKALETRAVWACTSLIAEAIAGLPAHGFVPDGPARLALPTEPAWLKRFSTDCDPADGWSQLVVSLLSDGNAYAVTPRDRMGEVVEVIPQDPCAATLDKDRNGRPLVVVHDGARDIAYTAGPYGQILHVRGLRWPGKAKGMSPVNAARQAIGLGLAAEQFGALFFANGTHAGGHLETDQSEDSVASEALAKRWRKAHGGLRKAHLPAILTGGLKWVQTTVSPAEAQALDVRRFQVAEVAGFYRVPGHLIGDVERSSSWGTGIEEQSISWVTFSLKPWLIRLEQAFSRLVAEQHPGAEMRFNVSGLLRGDLKSRYEAYAIARQWGFASVDDILAWEDRPPLPDGQGSHYIVPLNMAPAGSDPTKTAARSALDAERRHVELMASVNRPQLLPPPPSVNVDARQGATHVDARTTVEPAVTNVSVEPAVNNVDARTSIAPAVVDVHVPEPRATTKTLTRDAAGNLTAITEEPA